jgi:hypothetical protein
MTDKPTPTPPRPPLRLPANFVDAIAERISTVIGIVGATAAQKGTKPNIAEMVRKRLAESQRSTQFRGTFSRRKLSVASANWAHVAFRVEQDGKTITAKKNCVWTCNRDTKEQVFNDEHLAQIAEAMALIRSVLASAIENDESKARQCFGRHILG